MYASLLRPQNFSFPPYLGGTMKKLCLLLLAIAPLFIRAQTHSLEKIWETDTIVADISNVVVIDIAKGSILKKIGIDGATGLNDITVDGNGIVYVSYSKAGKVYRIEKDVPTLYMDNLDGANGLMATNTGLYILAKKAVLFADANKNLRTITDLPNGGDGIELAANGDLVVSEWVGYVYYVHADGRKELLLDTHAQKKNTADIHYDVATRTLYIPEFFGKAVAAWKLH
jgi:hypothetical protein